MSKGRDVTEAELAVLEVLWDLGPSTIRTLTDRRYPGGGSSHYATVQKLLERLEAKGRVTRDRTAVPHVFSATVGREQIIAERLQDLADELCEGSVAPLLTHLVRGRRLSTADRDALRKLVDDLQKSPREGKKAP